MRLDTSVVHALNDDN